MQSLAGGPALGLVCKDSVQSFPSPPRNSKTVSASDSKRAAKWPRKFCQGSAPGFLIWNPSTARPAQAELTCVFLDQKRAFCSSLGEEGPLATYGGESGNKLTREEGRAVEPVAPRTKTSQRRQLSEALRGTAGAKVHGKIHIPSRCSVWH